MVLKKHKVLKKLRIKMPSIFKDHYAAKPQPVTIIKPVQTWEYFRESPPFKLKPWNTHFLNPVSECLSVLWRRYQLNTFQKNSNLLFK